MKIVGLITEYNPFHRGHLYHMKKAREVTGADTVIIVMSGNFVQRGAPAVMPKHLRAEAALLSGADLVLELPVCFATGSAEFFAAGAVSLLDSLGCVDAICFGSECGDCSALEQIAEILSEEPEAYQTQLRLELRKGLPFPTARQHALLHSAAADTSLAGISDILAQPNNILGIEYLKALARRKSQIRPFSIPRIGAGYHESSLTECYSSASGIRRALADSSAPLEHLAAHIPQNAWNLMEEAYGRQYPIYSNDFSLLLKYRLLQETKESLQEYIDISEDLANRIINQRNAFTDFEGFCNRLKTKDVTHTRISRSLLHILLNLKTSSLSQYQEHGYCHYAHILGFNKKRADLLPLLKKSAQIPLLTKLTQTKTLSDTGRQMLAQDIFASDLYESLAADKFHTPFLSEYQKQIVKV